MTAKLFAWIYDYYFGILNHALTRLRVLAGPVDWLGDDRTVMGAMIAVGVFVSLPFTTYVLLAGLSSIAGEVYEAARVDGASAWRTYRAVTLPLLRPALLVATVLNVIYVANSFPIVWTLNDRNPGCTVPWREAEA
jgi:ABC-type sugar transport system permease subunit